MTPTLSIACDASMIHAGMTQDAVIALCGQPTLSEVQRPLLVTKWIYSASNRKPPFDIIWFTNGVVRNASHFND